MALCEPSGNGVSCLRFQLKESGTDSRFVIRKNGFDTRSEVANFLLLLLKFDWLLASPQNNLQL